jgi:cytochrome c oxidase cbb3-type subunit I/II
VTDTSPRPETWHRRALEHKGGLFAVLSVAAILVGSAVEIVPMWTVEYPKEDTADIHPYTPLEVAGRDIYVREGCYVCHSQWVRPFRSETLRYGPWSRGEEYVYDRPFQLGSRRIGPDLHRVGGKYNDAWHYEHLKDPRSTSPGSIMPVYTWLFEQEWDPADVDASVQGLARLGHPYAPEVLADVGGTARKQADGIVASLASSNIQVEPDKEIVAVIAFLQRLGTDGRAKIAAAEAAKDAAADAGGAR